MHSSQQIKKFILDNLSHHEKDIIQAAINHFGISRQAIHKHMNNLISAKKVIAHGNTKGRYYQLMPMVNFSKTIDINNGTTQEILKNFVSIHLKSLPLNIQEIFEFSVGALLNNIFDHASALKIYLKIYITHEQAHFILADNGIGIFDHIRSGLSLTSNELAALELAKGDLTTDSNRHSGGELNTIIKLFDLVTIDSSGKSLKYSNYDDDWQIAYSLQQKGTRIHLQIEPSSKRTCATIFNRIFKSEEKKIKIPLNLLDISEYKIVNSRSQAKSVLRNIQKFKKIEFDFNKIDLIGPAFADELVRNVKSKNKTASIEWINCNKTVDLLMKRAVNRSN